MKVKVFNQKGKEVETIDLDKNVFDVEVNETVLSQYVYSYLSNQRQANAQTKDRSEVRGGGKKPWRQKGTGRARFGSSRVPIWTGGGVTFGPTNDRNWKKKLTKNFKKSAMKNALSWLLDEDMLVVVSELSVDEKNPLAKQAIDIQKTFENPKKVLVVTKDVNSTLINAFSNIPNAKVSFTGEVNVYELLNSGKVLIEKSAIEELSNKLSK